MGKNILIISFHYPPESNGGVQRPYAFSKYLKKHGYHPFVVTTNNFGVNSSAEERSIFRLNAFDGNLRGKTIIRKFYIIIMKSVRKLLSKMGFLGINNFKWFFNVYRRIDRIISETKPDIVFATFPTLVNLLIGVYIKKKYQIPLISDFRDGFVFEGLEKFNFIQKIVSKKIERNIVEYSDAVLTVSPPISNYFIKNYHLTNVKTIYNGFDLEDLKQIDVRSAKRYSYKFRMIYFGGFGSSRKRSINLLLDSLKNLKNVHFIDEHNFELIIYGTLTASELRKIKDRDLGSIIKYFGYIERIEGLKIIKNDCNALLFYGDPGSDSVVSTKLVEYIFMSKPILGVCKGNEAENIIIRTNTGLVVDFCVENIMKGFRKIIDFTDFQPDWKEINQFSRETQTLELIKIIEKIC